MRILLEEYKYEASLVQEVLHGIDALQNLEGYVSLSYVGYFYNTQLHDCVFILPKVLMDENELVFGKYAPESIIHLPESELTDDERKFLYEFAVWIYRAVAVYQQSHKDSDIIFHRQVSQIGHGLRHRANTLLDILLSLIQFNKDNENYITFVLKNLHTGFNKINWTRTISHSSAIVQSGTPIYINPVNKKRQINFDEELLIIFFSILNYISKEYGFHVDIKVGFPLIEGAKFESYLNGRGVVRLRQIKYKYFSDIALQLWQLCYAFFAHSTEITTSSELKEYLLIKDFYIVFEAIIDELIGDHDIPDGLKDQEDGKIVDHLYRYKSLTENDDAKQIYYIGDSKYYKMGHAIGDESIAKQFTYARNVIQWNLNLFLEGGDTAKERKLRDDITEGYNIIPNFFISAQLDKELRYNNDGISRTERNRKSFSARQFENRLFDRDTLLVLHYDVNFLFVVSLYSRNNAAQKKSWQARVREMFRDEIRKELDTRFTFYAMTAHADIDPEQYLRENFQMLLGKVYTPYNDTDYYSLALDVRDEFAEENEIVLSLLRQNFFIGECPLGTDPSTIVQKVPRALKPAVPRRFLTMHWLENYQDANILIGCYKDQNHLDWIQGKNDKGTLIYNVRLDKTRAGALVRARILENKAVFVILYPFGEEHKNEYLVYRVHHTAEMKEERMEKAMYPNPHGKYFCYVFDEEISLGNLDINRIVSERRLEKDFVEGAPFFIKGEELIKYRM